MQKLKSLKLVCTIIHLHSGELLSTTKKEQIIRNPTCHLFCCLSFSALSDNPSSLSQPSDRSIQCSLEVVQFDGRQSKPQR